MAVVHDAYDRSTCDVSSCHTHLLRAEECHSERYYLHRRTVSVICQHILRTARIAGGMSDVCPPDGESRTQRRTVRRTEGVAIIARGVMTYIVMT